MKWQKNNIFTIIISFVIALLLIEIFCQFFFADNFNNKRFIFITKPSLLDQNKSFGYHKDTIIREIAVYGNGKNFYIAYDYSFTTNNIGLVQKNLFDPVKKSILIIGDSFTQGQGANPWFYQLEDDWKNNEYQLINLGIIGTGIEQWKDTLQWFSNIGEINKLIICYITDDWVRQRWYACENAEQNGLAFNGYGENNVPIMYFIEKNSDNSSILKRANDIADFSDGGIKKFLKKIFLARFAYHVFVQYKILYHNYDEIAFSKNKTSFDQIISAYGAKNITVLHLPQKEEVIQGRYSTLGIRIKDFILSRHIQYIDGLALCNLNKGDFYKDDPHPNASGYKKIYDCFSKNALRNLKLE